MKARKKESKKERKKAKKKERKKEKKERKKEGKKWLTKTMKQCSVDYNPKHTVYTFTNLNWNLNCDMLKR